MFHRISFAIAAMIMITSNAFAESWYVVDVSPRAAVIVDTDSRKIDQNAFVTVRNIHPGIQEVQKIPIVASQFSLEFDCKESRFRTIEFALVDVDGRIPNGLKTDKIRDWDAAPNAVIEKFACGGQLPEKTAGLRVEFTDIESKYLMWLEYGDGQAFSTYVGTLK